MEECDTKSGDWNVRVERGREIEIGAYNGGLGRSPRVDDGESGREMARGEERRLVVPGGRKRGGSQLEIPSRLRQVVLSWGGCITDTRIVLQRISRVPIN
jgi:hypothetical protein